MHRTRLTGWLVGGVGALLALMAAGARADEAAVKAALDLAPAEAPMVLVVPNGAALSEKISKLAQSLGLPIPVGELDLIAKLKQEGGLTEGLRDDGPVALVITDVAMFKGRQDGAAPDDQQKEPSLAILMPVSDYQRFVGNFVDRNVDGEVISGKGRHGEDMFLRNLGSHAMMAPTKDIAAGYQPAKAAKKWLDASGKLGGKLLADADAVLFLDMTKIGPAIEPQMKEGFEKIKAEMANGPQMDAGNPMMAMMKPALGAYFDALAAFVRDSSMVVVTGDITDKGVGFSGAVQFTSGSPTAKLLSNGAAATRRLALVPDQPFFMALAWEPKGLDVKTLVKQISDALTGPNAPRDGGIDPAALKAAIESMANVQGMGAGYYLGNGAAGPMTFSAVTVMETTDPAGLRAAQRAYYDMVIKAQKAGDGEGAPAPRRPGARPMGAPPAMEFTFQADATEIDGLKADEYTYHMALPAEAMMGNPMAGMLGSMTNGQGYLLTVGNYVVQTLNCDLEQTRAAINGLKQGKGLGEHPGLKKALADGLPADASMQFYFNVGGLVQALSPMMMMFGIGQIQVPEDLPPIAMGMNTAEGALGGRLFVSQDLMAWVKGVFDQVQAAQQGGAPGRGPRRGPPRGF